MVVFEESIRRRVFWLDGDVLEALQDLDHATLTGDGILRSVTLRVDGERREHERVALLRLSGVVHEGEVTLLAVVLVQGDTVQGETVAGEVIAADAEGCRLEVEEFAEAVTREDEAHAPADGSVGWAQVAAASAEAAKDAATTAAARTWAKADLPRERVPVGKKKIRRRTDKAPTVALPEKAPIGKKRPRDTAFVDEPLPEPGDFVDHRQFGICEVVRIDDDGGLILKLEGGRRRRVVLDVFHVLEARIEGEKIIYPLRPRKR